MAQWRRFAFFDKELVKDADNKTWLKGIDVTCVSANRGKLIIGDSKGNISIADRQLEVVQFQAYDHFVSHVVMLHHMNVLVTVGDGIDPRDQAIIEQSKALAEATRSSMDEDLHYPPQDVKKSTALVKVWRTDQQDRDGRPKLLQQIRIFAKYPEDAVTSFAVYRDLTQVALGLKNGAVIVFKSNLKRRDQPPPILLQPSAASAVTGLAFAEVSENVAEKLLQEKKPVEKKTSGKKSNGPKIYLYVATKRSLTSYQCSVDSDHSGPTPSPNRVVVLDERGVETHCSAVNDEGELAVGQTDAVYFYNPEDRGVCFGFDGEKRYLHFFKHYLCVAHIDPRGRHQINVYDLKNKFIAFNWTLTTPSVNVASSSSRNRGMMLDEFEEVRHVVSEWGAIFVFTSVGFVYKLTEKDITSKLEILFRKNLYSIAISLAYSSNYNISNIMDIFRMYGDHLYQKGDFDGAVTQYTRTIGHVEPSYVIRKFLDAQRIHNLTTYLEALHEKAFANADHTTLLLNCYTKLKDVKKLDRFICPEGFQRNDCSTNPSSTTGKVNVTTSSTMVNETKSNSDGVAIQVPVNSLTFDVETAISVCRASYPEHALYLAKKHQEHSWYLKIQLEDISYSAEDGGLKEAQQLRVADALEYIKGLPAAEAERNLKKYGKTLVTHLPEQTTEILKLLCTGRYVPTNSTQTSSLDVKSLPEEFIHLYVAHPQQLKMFLDYIVEEESSTSSIIGNTLLELLLQQNVQENHTPKDSKEEMSKEDLIQAEKKREDDVMALLDNPRVSYDADHALVLVQMHGLKRGQLYLFSKLHMYHMVVQHYMEEGDDRNIIIEVKKHGDKDPSLWLQVLKYFADRGSDSKDRWDDLKEVLDLIDKDASIPPLQVVQVLSQARRMPLSVVRKYLISRLKSDQDKIDQDQDEIQKFKVDTDRMRQEIKELKSRAVVFQSTKCDLCKQELDPPAVHFMCMHSFHQCCIPETDRECLICAPEHRHVITLKTSLEQKAGNHEQFFNQLETSGDGFNTIAEYFGKGIFKSEC